MIQKQIVYLPIEGKSIDELMECKEGYFLTYEQLNEYTANVIRKALETAAKSKSLETVYTDDGLDYKELKLSKKSILNSFKETFKLFEV